MKLYTIVLIGCVATQLTAQELAPPTKAEFDQANLAAINGDLEAIRNYVEVEKLDPNTVVRTESNGGVITYINDHSLLRSAARNGHIEIVRYLLDKGVDADIGPATESAIKRVNREVAVLLINHHFEPDLAEGKNFDAYLFWLATRVRGSSTLIIEMLKKFENLDAVLPNKITKIDGSRPIHIAAKSNDVEVAKYLIGRGVGVNHLTDPEGWVDRGKSPLHLAVDKPVEAGTEVIDLLLAVPGINVNAVTVDNRGELASPAGDTALHIAAYRGRPKVVAKLLAKGANPDIRNERGNKAWELAMQNNHEQVRAVLTPKRLMPLPQEKTSPPSRGFVLSARGRQVYEVYRSTALKTWELWDEIKPKGTHTVHYRYHDTKTPENESVVFYRVNLVLD